MICVALCCTGQSRAGGAFDSVRTELEARRITTVEGLIAALPADMRAHYALVFASRSLQGGSFEAPRAILFGRTAEFIASFNGDPAERGYAAVETMEFDARQSRFTFREIAFPDAAHAALGDAVTISEPNPARCVACHDRPARPIWDLPPSWPGVYGERYRAALSAAEAQGMQRFLRLQPAHPRYRQLADAASLADRDTYVPNSRVSYAGSVVPAPNERLSTLLANLNVRAILAQMAAVPGFEAHRYVLLGVAGSSCGAIADFYPDAQQGAIGDEYGRFAQAAGAANRRQSAAKAVRSAAGGNSRGLAVTPDLTQLRFVAERDLQVSTEHWTLALERGTYDYSAPEGTLSFEQALYGWVGATDASLRDLAPYRTFDAKDAYCAHLRRESRREIALWQKTAAATADAALTAGNAATTDAAAALADATTPPPLLDRCIACHSSGAAPALPFADTELLKASLARDGYPRGRLLDEILYRLSARAGADSMPRGMNIGAAERAALEGYFLALLPAAPLRTSRPP